MSGPGPTAPMVEEADAPAWSPGRAIDRYIVLRSIGAGGCGEVLAAFDPVLDRNGHRVRVAPEPPCQGAAEAHGDLGGAQRRSTRGWPTAGTEPLAIQLPR